MSSDYIKCFWDALDYEIERVLGPHNARVLFEQLFKICPDETRILRNRIRLPTLTCESEHKLQTIQPSDQLTRASEVLAGKLGDLLNSLIGARLTSTLRYAAMVTANRDFQHAFGSKMDD